MFYYSSSMYRVGYIPYKIAELRLYIQKRLLQIIPCIRSLDPGHLLRRSLGNDPAPVIPAFRAKVNYMVGNFYHIKIVLETTTLLPALTSRESISISFWISAK